MESDSIDNERPSKTKQKKEMNDLQAMCVKMSALPTAQLASIPMSEALKQAIVDYHNIKSNAAKRRQAQWLGKLVRREDNIEDIKEAYDKILGDKKAVDANFHLAERWRERLLKEDKAALTQFLTDFPLAESQALRHAIKKAKFELDKGVNHGGAKALFRLIRGYIE